MLDLTKDFDAEVIKNAKTGEATYILHSNPKLKVVHDVTSNKKQVFEWNRLHARYMFAENQAQADLIIEAVQDIVNH